MFDAMLPAAQYVREDQIEQLEGDDAAIRQFKRDGDVANACRQLDQDVRKRPKNATALFNLGCLTVVSGDWLHAIECFAKVRQMEGFSALGDKAQRQLRQIGSYYVSLGCRGDAKAMFGLGTMYERGWGPKPNRQEAKTWYRNAFNAGNADAAYRLAVMYEDDLAAGPNSPQAEAWYRQQVRRSIAGRRTWAASRPENRPGPAPCPLRCDRKTAQPSGRPPPQRAQSRSRRRPRADAAAERKAYEQWVQEYTKWPLRANEPADCHRSR